jgi:hypothetical protein
MMHQEKSGNPVAISGEQNALNVESCWNEKKTPFWAVFSE